MLHQGNRGAKTFTFPLDIDVDTTSNSERSHASLSGMSRVFQLETVAIQRLFFHRQVAGGDFPMEK